jgi:hypothetical protein
MFPGSQPGRPLATGSETVSAETVVPVSIASGVAPWINRKASEQASRAAQARQTSGRRRYVDPATSERDYTGPELEFMNAMQAYKKSSGRLFPTWSEVLEVLRDLGYRKPDLARPGLGSSDDAARMVC